MYDSFLLNHEKEEFYKAYDHIVNSLCELNRNCFGSRMREETEWMKSVLDYNVLSKDCHLRGSLATFAYKSLLKLQPATIATIDGIRLDFVLGWITEIYHGAYCITSNITDEKNFMSFQQTQKAFELQSSWHSLKNVGLTSINDGFMLKMANHNILKYYFAHHSAHFKLECMVRDANQKCICGRTLHEQMKKCENIADGYTMQRYRQVVKHENSYYSFYMPIAFAMGLAGKSDDAELMKHLKDIMLEIGCHFQLGIDYFEIFGGEENEYLNEKLDKLSWFFVRAIEKCKQDDRDDMINHIVDYIDRNDVYNLRNIYLQLDLVEEYQQERKASYKKILKKIDDLPEEVENQVSRDFFLKVIKNI